MNIVVALQVIAFLGIILAELVGLRHERDAYIVLSDKQCSEIDELLRLTNNVKEKYRQDGYIDGLTLSFDLCKKYREKLVDVNSELHKALTKIDILERRYDC